MIAQHELYIYLHEETLILQEGRLKWAEDAIKAQKREAKQPTESHIIIARESYDSKLVTLQ